MEKSMTETDYLEKIEAAFAWIENRVDGWNADFDRVLECHRKGSVLETEFEDGQKIIVNAQAPTQQLWLASIHGAYHFVWRDDQWLDTRGQGSFEAVYESHARALGDF